MISNFDPDTNRAVTSAPSKNDPILKIQDGLCYVTLAYDAARSIDLNKAAARVREATQRSTLRHKRPAPSYFEYQPAPLRLTQDTEAISYRQLSHAPERRPPVLRFRRCRGNLCRRYRRAVCRTVDPQ